MSLSAVCLENHTQIHRKQKIQTFLTTQRVVYIVTTGRYVVKHRVRRRCMVVTMLYGIYFGLSQYLFVYLVTCFCVSLPRQFYSTMNINLL